MPHITQIAAIEPGSKSTFDSYIIPTIPISPEAQQITGIVKTGPTTMAVHGQPVQPLQTTSALEKFVTWLNKFSNVVLVAHNGRRFDFPVLVSAFLKGGNVNQLLSSVCGFVDSLTVFRKKYPGRASYQQELLVRDLLKSSYDAHNAIGDVDSLGRLIANTNMSVKDLLVHSFTPQASYNSMLFNREKSKNVSTLDILVAKGVCKRASAENIAGSGLQLCHLRTIYQRQGEDGLLNTFTEKNSEGQPRVTNCKRTLESVIPKMADYFKDN